MVKYHLSVTNCYLENVLTIFWSFCLHTLLPLNIFLKSLIAQIKCLLTIFTKIYIGFEQYTSIWHINTKHLANALVRLWQRNIHVFLYINNNSYSYCNLPWLIHWIHVLYWLKTMPKPDRQTKNITWTSFLTIRVHKNAQHCYQKFITYMYLEITMENPDNS